MRPRVRLVLTAVALFAFPGLFPGSAALADRVSEGRTAEVLPPQVLGLIAAAQPIPLTCADGTCTALVSSFCLQQDRPTPAAGQRYEPAGAGDVTLVVTGADGSTAEFSAAGLLGYVSDGHFTRTRIEMAEGRLASLGATEVAVRIAPMVSLMPRLDRPVAAAVAARDAEAADGAPRYIAETFFAAGTPRADAAVTMTRLINLLPAQGPVMGTRAGIRQGVDPIAAVPAERAALWSRMDAAGGLRGVSPAGAERARSELDRCGAYAEMGMKLTLRGCLESSHDRTLREVNDEYWKSQPGY
jgi:hypothetical protein